MMDEPIAPPARPAAYVTVAQILTLAVFCALLSGILEGSWMVFSRRVLHQRTLIGPLVLWLAPVMDLLWFAFPAAALALLARLRHGRLPLRLVVGTYLWLSAFVLAMALRRLLPAACAVLALGIAVSLSAQLARRPGLLRVARTGALALAGLVLMIATAGLLVPRLRERFALAGSAALPGAPNVLLLILDTVRDEDVSMDGYDRATTPHLARFAEQGVRFSKAWSPSSWTLPAHASIFTGLPPHRLSAGYSTPLDGAEPTLAEVLTRHGYATGGFVANVYYASRIFGLDRGFTHYEDYVPSPGEALVNSSLGRYLATRRTLRNWTGHYDVPGRKRADDINRSVVSWLSGLHGRPYFVFANYWDAHEPYLPPAPFDTLFRSAPQPSRYRVSLTIRDTHRVGQDRMSHQEVQALRDAYDAAIAYLDERVGRLLDTLTARGLLENTIVIVTSDHGEMFGEHGEFTHGSSLYFGELAVPLLIVAPGRVPAGLVVGSRVSTRALAATVLDLAGISPRDTLPGRSLTRFWRPDSPGPLVRSLLAEVVFSSGRAQRSVVLADTQYTRRDGKPDEMFVLEGDSEVRYTKVVGDSLRARGLHAYGTRLDSLLSATGPDHWGP